MGKNAVKQNKSVRLTERDLKLLLKLNAAGWLTTRQIRSWFFQDRSTNAVCKRLRRLAASRYLAMLRTSSTEQVLYRLATRGKLALIEHTACEEADISIPSQLPRKIRHFAAINDLRLCFEGLAKDANVTAVLWTRTTFERKCSIRPCSKPVSCLKLGRTASICSDTLQEASCMRKLAT
jgi:hypothetical protein